MIKRHHSKHIDKKLRFRLMLYILISLILLGIVIFDVVTNRVSVSFATLGLAIGLGIGVFTARMFLLSWDKDAKKVISRLDVIGGVIIVLYVITAILRGRIIGHFVSANYVTGTSFSVVTGIMIGRVFGTGHKIIRILKEQDLLD